MLIRFSGKVPDAFYYAPARIEQHPAGSFFQFLRRPQNVPRPRMGEHSLQSEFQHRQFAGRNHDRHIGAVLPVQGAVIVDVSNGLHARVTLP